MSILFNQETREQFIKQTEQMKFDLIIIGGGITGAGVLRDAAMRGLKTLLIEKYDFSNGTSSRSSKLLHGGLRYLAKMQFGMTRESLVERDALYRNNPHLVNPMTFLYPIYKGDKNGPLSIRMGLILYKLMAGGALPWPKMLLPEESKNEAPYLRTEGLLRSGYYYDTQVDDSRLTLTTILAGIEEGGMALNYSEVIGFEKKEGRITGVNIKDHIQNKEFTAYADGFINVTGVFVDKVRSLDQPVENSRIAPSKGIHFVIPSKLIPAKCTVAFSSVDDGRPLFIIPWAEASLVGTTDTYEKGDWMAPQVLKKDVDYLLRSLNHYFPQTNISQEDIISVFSGVRPLVLPEGVHPSDNASDLSREDAIYEDPSGLVSMAGGKLTTYRHMAERLLNRVVKKLPESTRAHLKRCQTNSPLIKNSSNPPRLMEQLKEEYKVSTRTAAHLVNTYGAKAFEVLSFENSSDALSLIMENSPYLKCEVGYSCKYESTIHLTDLLTRRMRAALWVPNQGLKEAEDISRIMASYLGWDETQRKQEVQSYYDEIKNQYTIH